MKKKWEVRYFVTAVASIPVYKAYSKTETYRQAAKDGWGTVYRDENNALVCDEDCSASLYTKNGGYFGIFPYEEINAKEMPKQAEVAAIIYSDSCGYSVWAEDFNQIHIFVTYDVNGLIDSYRVEYGEDAQPCDGETEIRFEDLYQQPEGDWKETYRAEIPGTVEYQHKQEAARIAETAGATWMDADQQEQFRRICNLIDKIKSGRDFYHIINKINNNYELDVINAAREYKKCFNSAQYEQPEEAGHMEELREFYRKYGDVTEMDEVPSAGTLVAVAAGMIERDTAADATPALAYTDDLGVARCGECGAELLCNGTGDMPDVCPACGRPASRRGPWTRWSSSRAPRAEAHRPPSWSRSPESRGPSRLWTERRAERRSLRAEATRRGSPGPSRRVRGRTRRWARGGSAARARRRRST